MKYQYKIRQVFIVNLLNYNLKNNMTKFTDLLKDTNKLNNNFFIKILFHDLIVFV